MDRSRHGAGAPNGGQFAAEGKAPADPSIALEPPVTPDSVVHEVGQERQLAVRGGEVAFSNVRVALTESGYELRADQWMDLTALQAEAYQDVEFGQDLELDPAQATEAVDFLNDNREHVDAFLAERWGATNDDTTEWDHTRLVISEQLPPDADLTDLDSHLDTEGPFGRYTEDMSIYGAFPDITGAFRTFIEERRNG